MFLRWFLDIFNVKIQDKDSENYIKIMYQVKVEDLLVIYQ